MEYIGIDAPTSGAISYERFIRLLEWIGGSKTDFSFTLLISHHFANVARSPKYGYILRPAPIFVFESLQPLQSAKPFIGGCRS